MKSFSKLLFLLMSLVLSEEVKVISAFFFSSDEVTTQAPVEAWKCINSRLVCSAPFVTDFNFSDGCNMYRCGDKRGEVITLTRRYCQVEPYRNKKACQNALMLLYVSLANFLQTSS